MQGNLDPLIYDLVGPRFWASQGRICFSEAFSFVYQASYWDYLGIWGNVLLGSPDGGGLIEAQFFAQWIHLVLGFGGTLFAFYSLFKVVFPSFSRLWLYACLGAASTSAAVVSVSYTAKNDWGALLWVVSGCALLGISLKTRTVQRSLMDGFAGIFFGFALVIKVTNIFGIVSIGLWVLLTEKSQREIKPLAKRLLPVVIAAGFSALPILIRNAWATGNPFFPFLGKFFSSPGLAPDFYDFMLQQKAIGWTSWARFTGFFVSVGKDSIFSALALVLVPVALGLGLHRRRLLALCLFVSLTLSWLVVWDFEHYTIRWIGAGLILCPVLTVVALRDLLELIEKNRRFSLAGLGVLMPLLILLGAVWSAGPVMAIQSLGSNLSPEQALRGPRFLGGSAKAWLRMNLKPGERAASTGDETLYYVEYLEIFSIIDHPIYDREARKIRSERGLISFLRGSGFRYLLDSGRNDAPAWGWFAVAIHQVLQGRTQAIVFEGPDSIVIDVPRLTELAGEGSEKVKITPPPLNF